MNPEYEVENVRPYSPSQQDILRIYEEGVLNSVSDLPEEISDILKKFTETDLKKRPSRSEICVTSFGWNRSIVLLIPVK